VTPPVIASASLLSLRAAPSAPRSNPTFFVVASEVRSLDHGASGAAGADFWRGAAI